MSFPTEGTSGGSTKVERLFIPGTAGKLEAVLEFNPTATSRLVALVCHPHPLHGGTLHNKVVFRAAKTAIQMGLPTLRFNFRGVGKSEGTFAGGMGEREDVRAALDCLGARYPTAPACLIGFSFGAWVGLAVGATDPRVWALVGLGLPAASEDLDFLLEVPKPKCIIQGTQDRFGPCTRIESLFAEMVDPKCLHWVEGADHFFTGKLDKVQAVLREFLQELVGGIPRRRK